MPSVRSTTAESRVLRGWMRRNGAPAPGRGAGDGVLLGLGVRGRLPSARPSAGGHRRILVGEGDDPSAAKAVATGGGELPFAFGAPAVVAGEGGRGHRSGRSPRIAVRGGTSHRWTSLRVPEWKRSPRAKGTGWWPRRRTRDRSHNVRYARRMARLAPLSTPEDAAAGSVRSGWNARRSSTGAGRRRDDPARYDGRRGGGDCARFGGVTGLPTGWASVGTAGVPKANGGHNVLPTHDTGEGSCPAYSPRTSRTGTGVARTRSSTVLPSSRCTKP